MSIASACLQDVLETEMANISSWFYRGEGNETLVVGLRGYNLVLRLKKKLRHSLNGSQEISNDKNIHKDSDKLLDFSRLVFLPLMGGKYVPFGFVIRLSGDFAEKLDKSCESSRPKHRTHKGIDASIPFAVLMPDLCFLPGDSSLKLSPDTLISEVRLTTSLENSRPTFSVEIKPKCGFLPTSSYIKEARSVKHSVCYYCMLQGVKVTEGKYPRRSQYCPVNFLSGDPRRVFHALKSLVSDPQNNLRVFKNGSPIFTHEIVQETQKGSSKEVCCSGCVFEKALKDSGWLRTVTVDRRNNCDSLGPYSMGFMLTILEIFIDDSKENTIDYIVDNSQTCMGNGHTAMANYKQDTLQGIGAFGHGGVLQRLQKVQKMDEVDIEGLYPLYFKVKDFFVANKDARKELAVDGPYNSNLWKDISTHLETKPLMDKPPEQWTITDIICKLCQFSVASTAKDCSIMLTFQASPSQPQHLPCIQTEGSLKEYITYSINLVDLDPKEFDRIVKYYRDSCTTTQHYLKSITLETVMVPLSRETGNDYKNI